MLLRHDLIGFTGCGSFNYRRSIHRNGRSLLRPGPCFLETGKYFVAEFKKEAVADFTVVEDNVCGVVHVPTEVNLQIPDMFGPESHCMMDVAVAMRYPSPVCVVVLERIGVARKDGHLFITHKGEMHVFPVSVENHSFPALDLEPETSGPAPQFRTSNWVLLA